MRELIFCSHFALQIAKQEQGKCKLESHIWKPEATRSRRRRREDEEEGRGGSGSGCCELSLSLSLPCPSSCTSEMSEAFSSYVSRSIFKDCSGSASGKRSVNLDLSIALCGT